MSNSPSSRRQSISLGTKRAPNRNTKSAGSSAARIWSLLFLSFSLLSSISPALVLALTGMTCSYSSSLLPASFPLSPSKLTRLRPPSRGRRTAVASLHLGIEDIAALAHNKVLVASSVACAVGQLSKPLTSAINGKGFDLKAAIRAGGMPSTHSAGVAAAATSLALERGFSDSIFGMSAVFAAFVMYDAQGVRREVGNHAKFLNMTINLQEDQSARSWQKNVTEPQNSINSDANLFSSSSEAYSFQSSDPTSDKIDAQRQANDTEEPLGNNNIMHSPLNESVGHTEVQVLVGAILGFIVSLAVDIIL